MPVTADLVINTTSPEDKKGKSPDSIVLRSPKAMTNSELFGQPKKYMSGYGGHREREEEPEVLRVITPTVGYRGHYHGQVDGKLGRVNVHKGPLSRPVEQLDDTDAALNHDRFANPPTATGALSRPGSPVVRMRLLSPKSQRPRSSSGQKDSPHGKYKGTATGLSQEGAAFKVENGELVEQHYSPLKRTSPNAKFDPRTAEIKDRFNESVKSSSPSPTKTSINDFDVHSILMDIRRALNARASSKGCSVNKDIRSILKFAFKPAPGGDGSMCKMGDFVSGLEALPLHLSVGQITALCQEFSDDMTGLVHLKPFIKKVAPSITAL